MEDNAPIATTEVSSQTDKDTLTSELFCSTTAKSLPTASTSSSKTARMSNDDDSDDSEIPLTKSAFCNLSKKSRMKKKKIVANTAGRELYGRCMMVAQPKSPISPQDVIYDERCDYYRRRVGEHCLNQRYGRYCIAMVYHYFCNNRCALTFSEAGVVQTFKEVYMNAYNRDLFLRNNSLTLNNGTTKEIVLPGCLEAHSLIFAVNMVLWEFMISVSQKDAGYNFKKGKKK